MTAVEWLVEQMLVCNYISKKQYNNCKSWLLQEAKEMEKEQIIEAGNSCALKQHLHNDRINKMTESELRQFAEEDALTFGEEFYNETYKK
jgi:hypothetical protein